MPCIPAPPDPDAELLLLLDVAEQRWADYRAADEEGFRLFRALRRHPDYRETPLTEAACRSREALAVQTGYRAAADLCEPAYERYDEALQAAFEVPARTLPGLCLKLQSALKAAKDRDFGTFEESDYRWLDMAMGDMERFAG